MMRVLIVDDEPLARRGARIRLEEQPGIEVVAESANVPEAVEAVRSQSPDLILLDVQMPGMDGFDLLRQLAPEEMPLIVFLTAYDKYALTAFEFHAIDYLLKPIDDRRFTEAMAHVRAQYEVRQQAGSAERIRALLESRQEGAFVQRFAVRTGKKIKIVPAEEVDWIEATGDYVTLHADKNSYLVRATMGNMEQTLNPVEFIRIHRGVIVRGSRICELYAEGNQEYRVKLQDGTEVYSSRTYYPQLATWLR
jgi:two-component system LytT family response regulator